jgi:hypothetical protein
MKKLYKILIPILYFISFPSLAQEFFSEMPIIIDDGVVKCKRIVVAFNQNVIPTTSGISIVDTSTFPIKDESVKELLKELSYKYGWPIIRKTIPKLVWGDTLVTNKRTGMNLKSSLLI